MSGYVAGMVWRAEIPGAGLKEKAVLANMADQADRDGAHIFPSKPTIAKETCLGLSTVKKAVKWLIEKRILIVVRQGGSGNPRDTTEYRIDLDLLRALHGDKGDGPQERARAQLNPAPTEPGSDRDGSLSETGLSQSRVEPPTRLPQRRDPAPTEPRPVRDPLYSEPNGSSYMADGPEQALVAKTKTKPKPPKPETRRRDPDEPLTERFRQVAAECGVHASHVDEIYDEFNVYWSEVTAKHGAKSERGWLATWRSRCRAMVERQPWSTRPPTGTGPRGGSVVDRMRASLDSGAAPGPGDGADFLELRPGAGGVYRQDGV